LSDRARLSPETLASLPADVEQPGYDRRAMKTGVVHLGVGAFHRAHQAFVYDRLLAGGDLRWGVTGASLRSPGVRDALVPQGGLYTLIERDGAGDRLRVIGSIRDVLAPPETAGALLEAMAAPDVHLVTLTITEKGYGGDAIGMIADAMALRRARRHAPFTAISCDNIAGNGARLEAAVFAAAEARDAGLRDWIAAHGAFPSTMVDRITPATTEADIDVLAERIGVVDRAMVKTEPFWQWVIEDRFAGPRPDFEAVGVQVVADVAPWETAKLRLLNGAHSAMAYLGGLAGLGFVHEFVADPSRTTFINRLWVEAGTTLTPTAGLDIPAYRAALLARFANPALNHALRQIAMDGSQKLPQRLVAPFAARIARSLPSPALALAIAAWMKWQGGRTDKGEAFQVDDPLAAQTQRIAETASAHERVAGFLSMSAVFPPELATQADILTAALDGLDRNGAAGMIRHAVDHPSTSS
jgi:fructuronate reductase